MVFGAIKNWFTIFKAARHHSVTRPIGATMVNYYCQKYGAQLQPDWPNISLVREVFIISDHLGKFHPYGTVF